MFEWVCVLRRSRDQTGAKPVAATRARIRVHAPVHVWREEILHKIPDMEAVSPDRCENKLAELFITGPALQLTQ